jgi:zinc protease
MLLRGTETRRRREFEDALEQLGAAIATGADADGLMVSGMCLARSWPEVSTLLREALSAPRFDPEQVAIVAREVDDELVAIPDDDAELVGTALRRALWGADHPYGRDPRGTRASVRRISPEDLAAHHARAVRSQGLVIGVAGSLDGSVRSALAASVGDIAGRAPVSPPLPAPAWDGRRRVLIVDKPDRAEAQLVAAQLGIEHASADFPAFLLANDAFGVGFGGRLFKEIRGRRGWTYYAYSAPMIRRAHDAWMIGMAPDSAHAAEAIAEAGTLASAVASEGFTDEEFERCQLGRTHGRPFLLATARSRLELALAARLVGFDKLAATDAIAGLDRAAMNAAFARVARPEGWVVTAVATADRVRDAFEERVGPVEVVGWQAVCLP